MKKTIVSFLNKDLSYISNNKNRLKLSNLVY